MLTNLKTTAVTALVALSVTLGAAAPAAAWGQRERDTLTGAVGALVLKSVIDTSRQNTRPVYREPVYQEPVYQEPVYRGHPRRGHDHGYEPAPRRHHAKPAPSSVSIYSTPAAHAFNSYSSAERRLIQRRLAQWGYYRGGVDGAFGPGTYSAVVAYARQEGQARSLGSTAGAFGVYDGLIY